MKDYKINKNIFKALGLVAIIVISCIILFSVISITFIIYNGVKYPSIGEILEVDFSNSNYQLSEEEYKKILNILHLEDNTKITIDKIAYIIPFRDETSYYILFDAEPNEIEEGKFKIVESDVQKVSYKYEKILFTTNDANFITVRDICNKYYKRR